ncbi:MAG: hypothetical protein IK013_09065 [Bacteroidales bacterium]|nr:hypothetical protein [Bacteroidales bacterium]
MRRRTKRGRNPLTQWMLEKNRWAKLEKAIRETQNNHDQLYREMVEYNKSSQEERRRRDEESKKTDQLFKEVAEDLKKTDSLFEETRQILKELSEESKKTDQLFKELAEESKKTELLFKERAEESKKTDQLFKEMTEKSDRKFQEAIDQINRSREKAEREAKDLRNLFQNEWGRLIESLCTPAALKLFTDLNIGIERIYTEGRKIKDNGIDRIEADIILCNGTAVVVVEVKTTCTVKHVKRFLEKMEEFKNVYKEFAGKTVYAAVAAIQYNQSSDTFAHNAGLFVIRTSGDGVFSMDQPQKWQTY